VRPTKYVSYATKAMELEFSQFSCHLKKLLKMVGFLKDKMTHEH